MNITLLKKIATKLRRMRHKEHFDMEVYVEETDCGTAACIAGYACLMTGVDRYAAGHTAAMSALQLTPIEADRLFYAPSWPVQFRKAPRGKRWVNPTVYNDPKVAAARIEHFIATEGRE